MPAAEQRTGLYIDDTVKKSLEKLKVIILLCFRDLSLDLLRFSYLPESHQEPELFPLPFNLNANRFLWDIIDTSYERNNMSRELYVCTSIQIPSDAKKLPPALGRLFSPACHWL